MKIAILSDWHLGFNWGTELEMDPFVQLSQAFKQIEKENVDLILVAGDLFHKAIPSQEVFYEAIKLLNNINIPNNIKLKGKENILKIPMIAIVGNHEYRGKDNISTVELLEIMGFVKFIHCDHVTINNVSIFGMSGIPEKVALDVLKKWDPKPIENNYNILMIHQSIKEYLPFEDEMIASISLSNLPKGFNLIIDGHLHWSTIEKLEDNNLFLLPGSTVSTQIKKIETETKKRFYILNTYTNELHFINIENIRPTMYFDLKFSNATIPFIKEKIEEKLEDIKKNKFLKKPIVRIRIKGELKEGYFIKDLDLKKIEKTYPEIYISFSNKLKEKTLKESVDKLRELQKDKTNIIDISKEIFLELIKQTNVSNSFDYNRLYDILYNKEFEKAKDYILNKKIKDNKKFF